MTDCCEEGNDISGNIRGEFPDSSRYEIVENDYSAAWSLLRQKQGMRTSSSP
jgi:hypothetical protein